MSDAKADFRMKSRIQLTASTSLLIFFSVFLYGCNQEKRTVARNTSVVETLMTSTKSWDGSLYDYPDGQAKMTLLRMRVPSGFRTPVHIHPHPGIAYIAKGKIECVVTATKTLEAKEGDSIPTSYGNTPHYCENIGKEEALIYVFYAGVEGLTHTIPAN